jgi:hypothetical protein
MSISSGDGRLWSLPLLIHTAALRMMTRIQYTSWNIRILVVAGFSDSALLCTKVSHILFVVDPFVKT